MPKRVRAGVLVAIVLAAASLPARAEYPYAGFWDNPAAGTPDEDVARRCALSFFEQRPDGHYSGYVLDRKIFADRKQVVYRRYSGGACTFEQGSRLESCHSETDLSDREDQTYMLYDVLTAIAADRVGYVEFDTLDEARAAIAEGNLEDSEDAGAYVRCPLPADVLKQHMTPDLSTASEDDINALTDPDDQLLHGGLPDAVLKALGAK